VTLEGDLQIGYEIEKMDRRVINMLLFYCNRLWCFKIRSDVVHKGVIACGRERALVA
jgi:hypothetical protein